MSFKLVVFSFCVLFCTKSNAQKTSKALIDSIAENMLLYQRANGGWPKQFPKNIKVNYKLQLSATEKEELAAGYKDGIDATIDNEATTKEIRYLAKAFKQTNNPAYLNAAELGVKYLLKAQYANGGWPQFFPDFSSYRSQVTFNDNAIVNVLNVLFDIVYKKNNLEVINDSFAESSVNAIVKGVQCILKTQIKQNGKLTAWCAQYNAVTLKPEMARRFELESLSGMESVGIVRFLMKLENPSVDIKNAIHAAIDWFEQVKIKGFNWVEIISKKELSGKDKILIADSASSIWARFYDLNNNEPFFCGRDSGKKKTVAEIENERRIGYAWYGTWPEKLLNVEYVEWSKKFGIK